ncbi:protein CHAPERONE-LIKE PROTEIN OF POR1, chloroplastic [Eucalyptus grandis]|uniref:protein CHAPERONE-LIKE PROTEIN OF POR1, chloroplastic n=1 Tax=Eucalyptus grandis TaxID=71139 RepID=UPI00192EF5F8|nr:protein CHAPERONE-LIKE PROTEIN OF POR1, chloroplastic [Eucalyptus grandis]
MAATTLSVRPNRLSPARPSPSRRPTTSPRPPARRRPRRAVARRRRRLPPPTTPVTPPPMTQQQLPQQRRAGALLAAQAGRRADDSAPFEMSVESALKLLGVPDTASFDEILRAKNAIVASCKDDKEAIAQVEAAYDMLLMRSLTQRRAGKVVSSSIRYADVKPVGTSTIGSMPQWLQTTVKNTPLSVEAPSTRDLGLQIGVYGALIVLTYVNGASTPSVAPYAGADVPGLILASSFGASLYFMTKKNLKLGKATIITIGGLLAGAVVGSAVESWLQVDIVPFLGIHSPAAVISEFILFSQLFASLYLR